MASPSADESGAPSDHEVILKERIADLEARLKRQAAEIEATYALLGRERAERRRADVALSTATQMVEGLFAHAPIAIEIFDREGFSFRMNEVNRILLGASRPEHDKGEFRVLSDPLMVAEGYADLYARAYAGEVVRAAALSIVLGDSAGTRPVERRTVRLAQTIFPIFDEDGAVSAVIACSIELVSTPPAEA